MENKKTARKILLVDDDADDRKYFIDAVAEIDARIECVTAKDGLQALELLQNDGLSLPDFIFLDLNMPRMNGKLCLEEIKKQSRLQQIPIVIYTTSSGTRDKEQLLAMGAFAFVTKPPEFDQLISLLKNIFVNLK